MNPEQIKSIVENSILKADHVFEHPPICLEVAGKFGTQIFATLGNFSTLLASPKAGKTTAAAVIVSSLLSGEQISNFIPSLPDDKKFVVWIDTEQANPECVKTIQFIASKTTKDRKIHPQNLEFVALRKYNNSVRIEAIEYALEKNKNRIGFLVIDGIRDLVQSINDEKEATKIADFLLKWSQVYNIHILAILHQNKGDTNGRGHIGTELMNKAETVASLERGENSRGERTTIVDPKLTRHKEFEKFAFTVDNDSVSESEIKEEYQPTNPKVNELTVNQLETIVNSTLNGKGALSYSTLWKSLKGSLKQIDINFGDNKCKELVTHLKEKGYVNYDQQTQLYHSNISLNI